MKRRAFIQSFLAMSSMQAFGGCAFMRCCEPEPEIPADRIVIDAHAHTFNAADLPVAGFIEYVALSQVDIPGVSILAGILVQAIADVGAPGFDQERARLEILLGPAARVAKARAAWQDEDKAREERYRQSINDAIDRLADKQRKKGASAAEQEFLRQLYKELGVGVRAKGPVDWYSRAQRGVGVFARYLVWGFKLLRYRYQQVENMQETYSRIDLFAPALVDYDLWFARQGEDARAEALKGTRVPIDQQMELMQLIVRWSGGAVHPYVAYDPRRDVEHDGQALRWVKEAIVVQGAVGVKLYPPMGFVALGNKGLAFCNSNDAKLGEKLDRALLNLYRYCEREEIPLLAHAANSNYNGRCAAYRDRAHPRYWASVLQEFPGLHLNLGHFGTHELPGGEWSRVMRDMMLRYEHVYADLSHVEEIEDARYVRRFFGGLNEFFGDKPGERERLKQRILYGSDWIMLAKEKIGDDYFDRLVCEYGKRLGDQAQDQFAGRNSMRFLGLVDGKSRDRLFQFYETWNVAAPAWSRTNQAAQDTGTFKNV